MNESILSELRAWITPILAVLGMLLAFFRWVTGWKWKIERDLERAAADALRVENEIARIERQNAGAVQTIADSIQQLRQGQKELWDEMGRIREAHAATAASLAHIEGEHQAICNRLPKHGQPGEG